MQTRKLIIIGSGPAGYTAGIYGARAELAPLLFAGAASGGQLMNTTVVENWPGAKDGVMGPDLMMAMREQAKKFGAEIVDDNVTAVDFSVRPFKVWSNKSEFAAEAVIVATGAESIRLGVPGEEKLFGRGVATCAVCDAAFYRGKNTFVVGGGDAAIEDALALTKFAAGVTMVVRRDAFRASKIMAKRAEEHPKIKILWNSEVKEILGEAKVEKVKIFNNQTQKEEEIFTDGVFLAIGHKPVTEMFAGKLTLDEKGYLVTRLGFSQQGLEMAGDNVDGGLVKFPTATSVEGVFGAGDVVDFRYRQAVTAAGMGCQAALDAERWLETVARQ